MKNFLLALVFLIAVINAHAQSPKKFFKKFKQKQSFKQNDAAFVSACAIAPDNSFAVSAAGGSGKITVWNLESGVDIKTFESGTWVREMRFLPNGLLVSINDRGRTEIWNIQDGERDFTLKKMDIHTGKLLSLALSADGKMAAVGTEQSQIIIWNTERAEEIDFFEEESRSKIKGVAFSPDGKYLASSWDNGKAVIWDIEEGEITKILVQDLRYASQMKYSPDGKKLAMVYRQDNGTNGIRIWNTENYEVVRDLLGHEGYINGICFSPDNKVLLSGGEDKTARIWQVSNGRRLVTLKGHESGIKAVDFSADGQLVVTSSSDYTTRIWGKNYQVKEFNKSSAKKIFKAEPTYTRKHSGYVNAVDFSNDNKYLVTGSSYNDLKLWKAATGKEILSVKAENKIIDLVFHPDPEEMSVIAIDDDPSLCLWDMEEGEVVMRLKPKSHPSTLYDVSVYGTQAAVSNRYGVNVWDLEEGKQIHEIKLKDAVNGVCYSPDGKFLGIAGGKYKLCVLKAENGEVKRKLDIKNINYGRKAAFSHDGNLLATAHRSDGGDHCITLWNTKNWEAKMHLLNHRANINSLYFSHDNKMLVSGANDGEAIIWDTTTGRRLQTFSFNDQYVMSVALSKDGKLAIGCSDYFVKVWVPQQQK
ncbi:WD40 repeat domain-containing protein [Candidatus Uabimicrobium sp. HlEnr_7]|uniref:WD40 repeat domain-containing protein n=1 Tax=Candidatus Uabimicrobium helgolandensis TaxID=3095367 RepID=UPI003556CAF2